MQHIINRVCLAFLAALIASVGVAQAEEDEGFVSEDQSGNDPRDFTTKFMPYYRYTELENDLAVNEFVMFGFVAFTGRIGMTYEVPIAKKVDYGQVDGFKAATANGCPPEGEAGDLPPNGPLPGGGGGIPFNNLDCDGDDIGLGDTILRFFVRPQSLEYGFGENKSKNFSLLPTLEFTAPTASEDVLGGEALIASPGMTLVFDSPAESKPLGLGFFAMMNFYDFDAYRDSSREKTSRYRGRWFWMQPLSIPTPEFSIFDTSGLYIMTEAQPVYDFEEEHFSFWIGPEFGKIFAPGHVGYFKPGFGVDPDEDEGDRDWTLEVGYRYFFD